MIIFRFNLTFTEGSVAHINGCKLVAVIQLCLELLCVTVMVCWLLWWFDHWDGLLTMLEPSARTPPSGYCQFVPPRDAGGCHFTRHGPPALPPHLLQSVLNADLPEHVSCCFYFSYSPISILWHLLFYGDYHFAKFLALIIPLSWLTYHIYSHICMWKNFWPERWTVDLYVGFHPSSL